MSNLKPQPSQIVTANEIGTGAVVFMTAEGTWTFDVTAARLSETAEESEAMLALAQTSNNRSEVELVCLIAAQRLPDGRPWPVHPREIIRALGPTVRHDLGYQADIKNTSRTLTDVSL